ncbi:winged helix-turn-helix domain-containing protein [Caballeronia sp. 15715]|jgi:two-component system, OmpR family, phosphate regulon response regulator PhoB|uniref:winged helix-turn-helix domain-containing protein n=1 Tax=Caballeronia sp. 15715 TaxID=3391030 RepID=UPI0039E47B0D
MSAILIVGDDPSKTELIWLHAQQAGHQPAIAFTGKKAKELIDERLPEVVILDWTLPDMTGLSLLSALRSVRRTKDLGVIVLGKSLREADTLKALEVGADFYLVKPFSMRELFARVQVMLRPRPLVQAQEVLKVAAITMSLTSHRVSVRMECQELTISLSPMAFKLLRLFLTRPGEVLSRDTILKVVWAEQTDAKERTVDVHVKILRDALRPFDAMIETVWKGGYRLSSENPLSDSLAI